MKCFKNILKISILLILLIVSVGSIYAADDSQNLLNDYQDDDLDIDDDFDLDEDDDELGLDDSDYDDLDDEDFEDDDEDDLDDDWDDEDFEDDDEDLYDDEDDFDYDFDDEDDYDDEIDFDENDTETDNYFQSFDYLELKTILYLERYGNATENWTETEHFQSEYQIYLQNPTNYTLNESLEGYQTYLKIFDSITSTFGEYNLTENETEYIKFMIIYYLNNYGNVSANYTWNESDEFDRFFPLICDIMGCMFGSASANATAISHIYEPIHSFFNPTSVMLTNSTSVNATSNSVDGEIIYPQPQSNEWYNILALALVVVLVAFVIV